MSHEGPHQTAARRLYTEIDILQTTANDKDQLPMIHRAIEDVLDRCAARAAHDREAMLRTEWPDLATAELAKRLESFTFALWVLIGGASMVAVLTAAYLTWWRD